VNKILRSWSVFILLVTVLGLFSFAGCDAKGAAGESFYKSLDDAAAAGQAQIKQELSRYNEDLTRKSGYEAKVKSLEPAIVDLSGYWTYDLTEFKNLQDTKITMQSIATMLAACKEISAAKAGIEWCTVCQKNAGELVSAGYKLEQLRGIWKTDYKNWTVTEYQKGVYQVAGSGLGFEASPVKGQWYFTVTDNSTKAVDPAAEALAQLLQKPQSYDEARKAAPKPSYSCIPQPSSDRRTVDFWEIGQVRNDWREGSSQVSSVTRQYPLVSQFWNQLSEIGYVPSFKGGLYWVGPDGNRKLDLYFNIYLPQK
jgi:hypothetical protein